VYNNISDKCKSKVLGLEIRRWVYIFVVFSFWYRMITYHQLTHDLLATHRESYVTTMNALRPSGDATQQ